MTETTEQPVSTSIAKARRGEGLSGMVLADLKAMASQLGLKGTSGLRKGDLVSAIAAHQGRAGGQKANPANQNGGPAGGTAAAASLSNGSANGDASSATATADTGAASNGTSAGRVATNGGPGANGSAQPSGSANGTARRRAASSAADQPANGKYAETLAETSATSAVTTAGGPEGPADGPVSRSTTRRRAATRGAGAPEASSDQLPLAEIASVTEQLGVPSSQAAAVERQTADTTSAARTDEAGENGTVDRRPQQGESNEDGGRNSRRSRRGRRDRDGRPDNGSPTTEIAATNGASSDSAPRENQIRDNQNRDNTNRDNQNRQTTNRADSTRPDSRRPDNRQDTRGQDRNQDTRNQDNRNQDNRDLDEDGEGGRRGRRFRDRNRRGRERLSDAPDTEIREDDVLVPVAGIVDILDSYAFIRTSGYLAGSNDVYVSLSQVRKNGLRRGDAVTGAVRAPRDGEATRQKFNALVRLDSVNGLDPEQARNRPEFTKLTPLYPNERLRMETEPHLLTTRVIDLVMPVGKGQRALIVSPPKAGKTMIMQAIANAITTNNPEVHLMVVLVDERPEEVTDMQRSVKGEVIASTFDRPPADHTMVAELAIERAKRLVEMGRDVVVLLDSITRLGRAYNLAAPASGRILSGGVDSAALFPPKRFLGAARNIEHGGSLTIFASALVETGSAGDTLIFEEFKGTGNAELKLDRRIADKRIFPAIDVDQSSTRKEDLLLSPDELAIIVKLRRVLSALDSQQALELILDRLRKTRNNIEFLMQVAKTTPGSD